MPPRADSVAHRNMLPPPTTAAIWMPWLAAAVISLAMCLPAGGTLAIRSGGHVGQGRLAVFLLRGALAHGPHPPLVTADGPGAAVTRRRLIQPGRSGTSRRHARWPSARRAPA